MERRPGRGKTGYGLLWALLASVAIHVLLFLLSWVVPLASLLAMAQVPPPESRITFTFAPPGEQDLSGNAPSAPRPMSREIIPVPPGERPTPSVAPPSPPVPEEPSERTEPAERSSPAAEAEFPEGDTDPYRPGPEERSFDIKRALSDFHRAVVRARRARPRTDSRSEGGVVFVPPDFSALPATGYGVGNLEFSSPDYDWSDYGRQIYIAIWRAWHNRLHATTDEFERWAFRNQNWLLDHANRIVFTIERNGEVAGIAIETPSGCIPLDDSTTTALEEVVLPPLPSDFPRDQETIRALFIAFGDIRGMRRGLEYRKRRGDF